MAARDERRLLRLQKQMGEPDAADHSTVRCARHRFERAPNGFVPLSKTDAELLFELIFQRYERGSTL
jgi:hypothetical protein